jgi:hypothetical protein
MRGFEGFANDRDAAFPASDKWSEPVISAKGVDDYLVRRGRLISRKERVF